MKLFYATVIFLFAGSLFAQSFVEVFTTLEPMRYSALDWGDFDNDGDLDLLASGARFVGQPFNNSDPSTIVYENDGSGNFTIYSSSITGVESGTALWGDYNNDNLLDVLICGRLESDLAAAEIWQQNNGVFTKAADLESLDYPNASWADVNNDGWLDIFLSGDADLSPFDFAPVSILYTNDQNGGFIRDDQTVKGVTYGGSEFADYDGDGDFDLVVTGLNIAEGYITRLYENSGGQFSESSNLFLGLLRSRLAWADIDNDGDQDVVVGGQEGGISATRTKMYRNDGGVFSEVSIPEAILPAVGLPSFDWSDFDNDGDLDLLLTGQQGILATRTTYILRNEGGFNFTALDNEIIAVRTGDAKWADMDNDGDADIAISGTDSSGTYLTRIYRNELNVANAPPSIPQGLSANVNVADVSLIWNASNDDHTPQTGIAYSLRIGSQSGASDIISPMANEQTGFRKVQTGGNGNFNTQWTIAGLPDGTYYWSVQAIDGANSGSAFADEQIFTVGSVTGIEDNVLLPSEMQLEQNYPNPFNPSTMIRFTLEKTAAVELLLFDSNGRFVETISKGAREAGTHSAKLDGAGLTSGVYFYTLKAGGQQLSKKLLLVR